MTADDRGDAADHEAGSPHRGRKQFLGALGLSVVGLGSFAVGSRVPRAAAATAVPAATDTRTSVTSSPLLPTGGGADDAVAIRAAIAKASEQGELVLLGPGTFEIQSAIELSYGVALRGASAGASVLRASVGFTGDVLTLIGASTVTDVGFQALNTARVQGAYVAIPGSECSVERCTFSGSYLAVRVGTPSTKAICAVVARCIIREPSQHSGSGAIDLVNYGNAVVTDCVLTGPKAAANQPDFGIRVLTGDTALISNTNVTSHGVALDVATAAGRSSTALQVVNSLFDSAGGRSSGAASSARIVPAGHVHNTLFSNCWFGLATQDGCTVSTSGSGAVNGLTFTGCQFVFSEGDGLTVSGSSVVNWSVTGGSSSGNGGAGIRASAGAASFTITGHVAGGSTDAKSVNAGRGPNVNGIRIDNGASDYIVTGCKTTGNLFGGIVVDAVPEGSMVANNVRPSSDS